MIRKIAFRIAVALIAVAAIVGTVGWIGSERALHPAYYHYKHSLADYPDLHPEDIAIKSASGIVLRGRFFEGSNHDLIILLSGYGDTQEQMLPYAEFLHRAGFDTLTYNARARSTSGGEYVTLGVLEQIDLESVIQYAVQRRDVDPNRMGALGISMGAATAILTGARDRRIRAIVDDCGFSDAPGVIATSFEHFIHLPAIPFAPVTVWIASHRAGIDVSGVRPDEVIAEISPRPILIIHGLADYVVPVANSERNFKAAREPKELWLVRGARHAESHAVAKAEYEKKVIDFFDNALK